VCLRTENRIDERAVFTDKKRDFQNFPKGLMYQKYVIKSDQDLNLNVENAWEGWWMNP